MTTRFRLIVLVFLVCASILLSGCSKQLSRSGAADLIQKQKEFTTSHNARVVIGTYWTWEIKNVKNDFFDVSRALQSGGILTLRESGKSYYAQREYIIELTPRGVEEAKTWIRTSDVPDPGDPKSVYSKGIVYLIPVARKQIVEVTGITNDQNATTADVQFDWKWQPTQQLQELAKMVPAAGTHHGEAQLRLYDDGWRIEQLRLE